MVNEEIKNTQILMIISFENLKNLAKKAKMCYYGANTCWFTFDSSDLYKTNGKYSLPCDPRGGMLFETNKPLDFIKNAEKNVKNYGKHGLKTFCLAYHGCVINTTQGLPTCFESWQDYNDLIDFTYQNI